MEGHWKTFLVIKLGGSSSEKIRVLEPYLGTCNFVDKSCKKVCLAAQSPHEGCFSCDITSWRINWTLWDASLNKKKYHFLAKTVFLRYFWAKMSVGDLEKDLEYQVWFASSILTLFKQKRTSTSVILHVSLLYTQDRSMGRYSLFWKFFSSVVLVCENDGRLLKNIFGIKLDSSSSEKIRVA